MKLAVFFSGIGYHCDKPLLYFTRELVKQAGFDEIINLSYACQADNIRGNNRKMREVGEILYGQAERSLAEVDFTQYDEILFVSKSIGTAVAAAYAMRHQVICKNIWYTPLAQTFDFAPRDGIAFTGMADPWVETDVIRERCAEVRIPLYEYENANHSLEVGDTLENLRILENVIMRSREYLQSLE